MSTLLAQIGAQPTGANGQASGILLPSPTLVTTLRYVNQFNILPGSNVHPIQFLNMLDGIGIQFTPFNHSRVVGIARFDWAILDDMGKQYLTDILAEVLGDEVVVARDSTHVSRYLIGTLAALSQPQNAFISAVADTMPTFCLTAGHTLAQQQHFEAAAAAHAAAVASEEAKMKEHIPRPPNPFIIYRSERHASVVEENPGVHNTEISIKLGQQWQNESAEVRALYKAKADQLKAEFKRRYPDYKYQPRKSSEVKRRRRVQATGLGATRSD